MSITAWKRALLTVAVALCGLTLLAVPAQARPFETGALDIDAFSHGDPLPFERLKASGATYVKTNVYWPSVAPGANESARPAGFNASDPADPKYNWAATDQFVTLAANAGLKPILTITNTPRWARAGKGCADDFECTPYPGDYAEFGSAVAKRYSGTFHNGTTVLPRVAHFQAWVEPNLVFFYKPVFERGRIVAADSYRQILNAFYDAIHDVHNSNKVIAAGLAPLKRPRATVGPMDFMRRLLCMTGRKKPKPQRGCRQFAKFDIWATHPYTTGGPTHKAPGVDDVALGDLSKMTTLLRAAERSRKIRKRGGTRRTPFWVTEFSYDSNPPDKGALKQAIHTRWSTEAMYRMYAAGVDTLIWFGYRDEDPRGRPHCEVFDSGLYRRGRNFAADKPKRFLRAFRFPLVALKNGRKGFTYWGRTPDSKPGTVVLQIKNGGGGYKTVKRVRARAGGVFQGRVQIRNLRGNALVRARAPRGGGLSVPFSLRYVRDFYQPPFGRCGGAGGGGRPR